LIALDDIGFYTKWLFDNPSESAGLELKVTTDEVSFAEIAQTFTTVTGKRAVHKYISLEEYLPLAEPYPNAPANWAAGPTVIKDDSAMSWRENFSAWWHYWGEGMAEKRDLELLTRIYPDRIKSLKDWMRKVKYDGKSRSILKGAEDLRKPAAAEKRSLEDAEVPTL
jgi:hypothetical protein